MEPKFTEEEKGRIFVLGPSHKWALYEPGGEYRQVSFNRGDKLERRVLDHLENIGLGKVPRIEVYRYVKPAKRTRASYSRANYDPETQTLTIKIPAPAVEPAYSPVVDVWLESFECPPIPTSLESPQEIHLAGNKTQREILINGLRRIFDDHPAAIQIGGGRGDSATLRVVFGGEGARISSTTLALYDQLSEEDRRALHDPDVVAAHLLWRNHES